MESNKQTDLKVVWEWDEWLQARAARRAVSRSIGPAVTRRKSSSSDKKLKAAFGGQRGPGFESSRDGQLSQ